MVDAITGGGGGGIFTGIDPSPFGHLVSSVSSSVGNAQPLASYYLSRFGALGVDTGAVNTLLQDYSWAQDQEPMLHRRYTLASALDQSPNNYLGDQTSAGAGALQYPTSAAAQAAGAKIAKEYQDGKISFKQFMSQLGQDDPDFDTGAVRTLGTTGMEDVESNLNLGMGSPSPYLKTVAVAVSAALANGFQFNLSEDNDDAGTNFDLLANLLPDATYPTKTLVSLANLADSDGIWTTGETQVTAVLTELGKSPEASAEFINSFPGSHDGVPIGEYLSSDNWHLSQYGNLYAKIITSGTVGAKTIDPKLADANVTALVQYYAGKSPSDTTGTIQQAYAKIIATWFPDVQAAISDPYYVKSPDGISLTADQWRAFLGEAMQNPAAGVFLLHFSATEAALLASNNPNNPEAQHASGLINGFFGYEAQQVYQNKLNQLQQEESSWDKVADLFTSIVLDPEGAVSTVVSAAVTNLAEDTVNSIVSGSAGKIQAPDVGTWQQEWQTAAAEAYTSNPGLGDPGKYQTQYHSPPFLDSQGNLVSNPTLAQRQAYAAWLTDPVLARASDQKYLNLDDGRLDGESGGS